MHFPQDPRLDARKATPMNLDPKTVKTLCLMLVAVTAVTFGDIFMSQAMKSLGEVKVTGLRSLWDTGVRVFTTPRVWLAISLMATFFFLWLTVLSYADLSYALPLTALTYVLNGLLVGPMLGESVGTLRWAGILFIAIGVALVTGSPSKPGD